MAVIEHQRLSDMAFVGNGVILNRVQTRMGVLSAVEVETETLNSFKVFSMQAFQDLLNGIHEVEFPSVYVEDKKVGGTVFTEKGMIVINASSGQAFSISENEARLIIPSNFIYLKVDSAIAYPPYLMWYFNESSEMKRVFLTIKNDTGPISLIPVSSFRELVISLPVLEKQRLIGNQYLKARDLIALRKRQLEKESELLNGYLVYLSENI